MATPADFLPDVLVYFDALPALQAERAILHAAREFCEVSGYWREDVTFAAVTGEYDYPNYPGVYALTVPTGAELHTVITPAYHDGQPVHLQSAEYLSRRYDTQWLTRTGTRARFMVALPSNRVRFVPYPTDADGTEITVTIVLRPAIANTLISDEVHARFAEQISVGARARLRDEPGTPYYEPRIALALRQRFEDYMADAKALAIADRQDRRHQRDKRTRSSHF